MQLVSVKKQNTFDATVSMIGRYIVENKLGEGARLPPETELAGRLGVSRNILREAMQHYRTLGIITSAPKMGASVAKLLPENPYGNYLPFLEASRDAVLPELIQMRYAVETGAGRFMTAGATPERLARLEALGTTIYRTDTQGEIIITSDGQTLTVTTDPTSREPAAGKDAPFIGNRNSMIVHSANCAKLPGEDNRVYFNTAEEAEEYGYQKHTCIK